MKEMLAKLICFFIPIKLVQFLAKYKLAAKHQYPPSTLIHRRKAKILFEIEFNWYDNKMKPISIVREIKSGKTFSIDHYEMYEFKEFQGRDRSAGNTIDGYGGEPKS